MARPIRNGIRLLREHGVVRFGFSTLDYLGIRVPIWNTVTSRYPIGTNVFSREWDLLVILDTCRVDSLRTVSESFPWLGEVGSMWSVGSSSPEWTLNTFTESYRDTIAETGLVSRNEWSRLILQQRLHEQEHDYDKNFDQGWTAWNPVTVDTFSHYEQVEVVANQDDRLHPEDSSIPHIVTDRAIAVGREFDCERLIVWYQMPHLRFIADALDWEQGELSVSELMDGPDPKRELKPEERSYDPARRGSVTKESVVQSYLQNLRLVLEYVEILLSNIDAEKVVISADHGEGLGDGIWAHPHGYPVAPVKTVPWAETTASDERTYESRFDQLQRAPVADEREEILRDMGYL